MILDHEVASVDDNRFFLVWLMLWGLFLKHLQFKLSQHAITTSTKTNIIKERVFCMYQARPFE